MCPASYILEVISFVTALISLMTGTSVLIIYDPCYAHKDLLESFKKSRLRLVLCLLLMAFPSLALVVSTSALMLAMFIAGVTSDKLLVKILTGATCAIFIVLAIAAIYVFNTPLQKAVRGDNKDTTDVEKGPSVIAHGSVSR
ncbi:hypothetical protein CY34DRAFT_812039 [Suillus luteus UH-Slu-Lm8-n1]|uniref:PGG domain-containing protein n=1 Tax=Suillus luteus UH-Slu-Lm8-n1 TaxID=930992 RepID=A0A0D0ABV9_9AGAM|nr:hypothetical protein CY34DRAFT_812039 [Suillus luteus UH-Slu-Lm8-n1]